MQRKIDMESGGDESTRLFGLVLLLKLRVFYKSMMYICTMLLFNLVKMCDKINIIKMLKGITMINTTLCYIEKDNKYLMLHRTKKENDLNEGKWIGVGGKFEKDETPEECLLREVQEETGLTLTKYRLRAVITFILNEWGTEYMYLFTSNEFSGEISECDEGELKWVDKKDILKLNIWDGDKIFLKKLIEEDNFFTLKVVYNGDTLVESVIQDY